MIKLWCLPSQLFWQCQWCARVNHWRPPCSLLSSTEQSPSADWAWPGHQRDTRADWSWCHPDLGIHQIYNNLTPHSVPLCVVFFFKRKYSDLNLFFFILTFLFFCFSLKERRKDPLSLVNEIFVRSWVGVRLCPARSSARRNPGDTEWGSAAHWHSRIIIQCDCSGG